MKQYNLQIITPRGIFYDGKATIITLKISEGYTGIMADRMPLMSSVKISKFILEDGEGNKKEGVIGNGIVKTNRDQVDILVNDVLWIEETSKQIAQTKLEKSKKLLNDIKEEGIKKEKAEQRVMFWELTLESIK